MSDPPQPPAVARSAAGALRDVFSSAGYRGDDARRVLQVETGLLLDAGALPIARRRVAAHETPLAALVSLFLIGDPLEEPERRLGPGAEHLVAAGLAREDSGTLRRQVAVVPHDDILIASDDPHGDVGGAYVPEVSRSSATLGSLTVRKRVERALDIGTGNGIQAVLASRHSESVVATDVSERALAFAEFNCALNGVDNVELRLGSFLEPVAGERFGLVVSNPPFAISPDNELVFRDSGLGRDRVSENLALALPSRARARRLRLDDGELDRRRGRRGGAAARVDRARGLRRLGALRGRGGRPREHGRLDRWNRRRDDRPLARLLRARRDRAHRLRRARAAAATGRRLDALAAAAGEARGGRTAPRAALRRC